MRKLRLLGAAVVLSTALAAPALAQEVIEDPGYCAQYYPNANCQNLGPGNPYTGSYQRGAAYRDSYNRWDRCRRDRHRALPGNSNAYYNTGDRSWSQSYGQRNGFVCQPGTWFRGEDGLRHICQ